MKYKTKKVKEEMRMKDYSKTVIFSTDDFNDKGHLLQTVTIPPQTKQREHYHIKQTEVFYILEGECLIFINNKKYYAKPGDAFICEPNDKHYLWNQKTNPFKLAVFKINYPDDDDTIWEV